MVIAMTANDYMMQYRRIRERILKEKETITALESISERTTTSMSDIRVNCSDDFRRIEEAVSQLVKKREQVSALEADGQMLFVEILHNITRFAYRQGAVLIDYYLEGKTLQDVGQRCGQKSRQWALDTRRKGEAVIQTAMEKHPAMFTKYDMDAGLNNSTKNGR